MSMKVGAAGDPSTSQNVNTANGHHKDRGDGVNFSGLISGTAVERLASNHQTGRSVEEIVFAEAMKSNAVSRTVEVVQGKIFLDRLDTDENEAQMPGSSTQSPLLPKAPPPTPVPQETSKR